MEWRQQKALNDALNWEALKQRVADAVGKSLQA